LWSASAGVSNLLTTINVAYEVFTKLGIAGRLELVKLDLG
jgi:hypothetical protein